MRTRLPLLLPSPNRFRARSGFFRLRPRTPITLVGPGGGALPPVGGDSEFESATELARFAEEALSIQLPIESHASTDGLGPRIELARAPAGKRSEQAYELTVASDAIRVLGFGPPGLRYGVETLKQLFVNAGNTRLASCRIEDAPSLEYRGALLDISRGKVPKPETIIEFMDWMITAKLNVLMLYTEHVFRFRRHPEIGRNASPLDAATLRMLDGAARCRHIELIPTLQSLGHMHHLLGIRRYAHLAESEKKWSISPTLEESYTLLQDLYEEYLPNFSSRWFNANCDEPVDLGKGLSKRWAERVGRGGVYRKHLERVRKIAAELGRRTMVWGDVVHEHPEEIPRLDRRMVFLDWWYEEDHNFNRVRKFKKHQIDFMVCPGTSSWNSLFPRLDKAFENIRGYARAGKRYGAGGLINTDWGDNGHVNLFGNSLLPFAWGAELSWASREPADTRFDRAFALQTFGDRSGRATRLLRTMGRLHDAGFPHFNHSAIKTVFFDSLTKAEYLSKVRVSSLNRTQKRLTKLSRQLSRDRDVFRNREKDLRDLEWAVDATLLATDKGLAAKAYLDWRAEKVELTRPARRTLAKRLTRIADEQGVMRQRLRQRWLARSYPNDFSNVRSQFSQSIRSLRRAARELESAAQPNKKS